MLDIDDWWNSLDARSVVSPPPSLIFGPVIAWQARRGPVQYACGSNGYLMPAALISFFPVQFCGNMVVVSGVSDIGSMRELLEFQLVTNDPKWTLGHSTTSQLWGRH
jgi:hypothetical protein